VYNPRCINIIAYFNRQIIMKNYTKKNAVYSIAILLSVLSGCKQQEDNVILNVDLKELQDINIEDVSFNQVTLTDNGAPVLLTAASKMLFRGDEIIIQNRKAIESFNVNTGVKSCSYSNKGHAESEFTDISDVWIQNGSLYLYDMNSKKIMQFASDGSYIQSVPLSASADSCPFQCLARFGKNQYLGKRVFGIPGTKDLAVYDSGYKFIKDIGDLELTSGLKLGYPFFEYSKDEVLYYRFLRNEVYAIRSDCSVKVKYVIDFGENNIPKNRTYEDEYEILDLVNSKQTYATLVSNVYESKDVFIFRFLIEGHNCMGVYSKQSKEIKAYKLCPPEDAVVLNVFFNDDKAFIIYQDMEKTRLTVVPVNSLSKGF